MMRDRIIELENIIARGGMTVPVASPTKEQTTPGRSRSPFRTEPPQISSPIDIHKSPSHGSIPGREAVVSTVVEILRDLSLEASGGFIGASSQITMGRLIGSIVQAKEYSPSDMVKGGTWEHLSPKSANAAPCASEAGFELSQVPKHIADRLFQGYIRHISTRWPVLQTPFMRRLHINRDSLSDTFMWVTSRSLSYDAQY